MSLRCSSGRILLRGSSERRSCEQRNTRKRLPAETQCAEISVDNKSRTKRRLCVQIFSMQCDRRRSIRFPVVVFWVTFSPIGR